MRGEDSSKKELTMTRTGKALDTSKTIMTGAGTALPMVTKAARCI